MGATLTGAREKRKCLQGRTRSPVLPSTWFDISYEDEDLHFAAKTRDSGFGVLVFFKLSLEGSCFCVVNATKILGKVKNLREKLLCYDLAMET